MQFKKFLVEAKKSTYASQNKKPIILDDNSKQLIFEQNNFIYHDRYYGFNPFSGQEIVFNNNKAIWTMNYYGSTTGNEILKEIATKKIYDFLKLALRNVNKDLPLRGPKEFKQGDFKYFNNPKGSIDNFMGNEKILFKNQVVYELNYFGGFLD